MQITKMPRIWQWFLFQLNSHTHKEYWLPEGNSPRKMVKKMDCKVMVSLYLTESNGMS